MAINLLQTEQFFCVIVSTVHSVVWIHQIITFSTCVEIFNELHEVKQIYKVTEKKCSANNNHNNNNETRLFHIKQKLPNDLTLHKNTK